MDATPPSPIRTAAARLATTLADEQVDFIPDPMVLRAAELFLLGRRGVKYAELGEGATPDDAWDVIDRNLDGVLTFFHLFMTRERIPLIDYEFTFPSGRFMDLMPDLVVDVHPDPDLYEALKDEARAKLARLDLGALPRALIADIEKELGTVGYEWYPDPGDVPDYQRVAATFALGGIIFGGYAQATGTDHVLQSKRARTFAELSLPQAADPVWGFEQEREVFHRLRQAVSRDPRLASEDFALPPTVVPHLLRSDPSSPREFLDRAHALRESEEGTHYRAWHTRLRSAWAKGRRAEDDEDDVEDVRREIEARIAGRADGRPLMATKLELETKAEVDVGVAKVGVRAAHDVPIGVPDRLRNWLVETVGFRAHRKLLLRMSLDQRAYVDVSRGLREVWMGG